MKKKKTSFEPILKDGISAVLIVKNEEAVLDRCLASLEGVDQIVVLDTGSRDKTFSIALRYTKDVSATPPIIPFHFAEARNRADLYAKHDWILTIDADEVLHPGALAEIRKAIQADCGRNQGFRVDFILANEEGQNRSSLRKMKVYRRGAWKWEYRVHEVLKPTDPKTTVGWIPEARMEHLPTAEKEARRKQNLELLKRSVAESPDYIRNLRQLGMEYFITGQWKDAVEWLVKYIDKSADSPDFLDRSETLTHLGRATAELGDLEKAMGYFDQGIAAAPERREPYFFKALALIKKAHLDPAVLELDRCLAVPESKKPDFHLNIESIWNGSLPKEALEFCRAQIAEAKALAMKQ